MRATARHEQDSLLTFEERYWQQGCLCVAGVDEAGRGPLAGPVVAAAVVLDPDFARREYPVSLAGLTDSKKLTARRRDHFYELLKQSDDVRIGVGMIESLQIDAINILRATHLAMAHAVADLPVEPDRVLVDGRPVPTFSCRSEAIVRGDSLSLSIAAASVIAKVVRDEHMAVLARQYPQYGFDAHKGYGTSQHMQALFEHGPCPEHRRSFRPVREALGLRQRLETP